MPEGVHARFRLRHGGFELDAELDLPHTGVSGILGPSGSGKTMLLRCFAGLERSAEGWLSVNGETWQSDRLFVAPEDRAVGVVFQDTRLFSHLSVEGNLRYGRDRTPASRRRITFDAVVRMLGIGHLLDRGSESLSGGESQRVAIGRTLLTSPALLLLDEPMAALDYARKKEILPFLDRLHRELDIPIVYVSHDLAEITRLATTLATIENGRILTCGPLAETLVGLDADHNARALAVTVEARAAAHDSTFGTLEIELPMGARIEAPGPAAMAGRRVTLRIAASDVSLIGEVPSTGVAGAVSKATVKILSDGARPVVTVLIEAGPMTLLSLVNKRVVADLGLVPGKQVHAVIRHAEVIGGDTAPEVPEVKND